MKPWNPNKRMLTDSRHARTKAASPSTRSVNSRVRSKQRSPGDSPCHKNSQCTHKQIQEHVETLYPLVCFSPCDSSVAPVTNLTWSNQQSNLAARMSPIFTCNKATLGSKTFIWLMFVQKTSDTHAAANISRDRVKATHPHANYQATSSTNDDSRCPQHSRCPQCSQALVWSPPPGHIEWHKQLQKLMIRSSHLKNASRTKTWPRNQIKQLMTGKISLNIPFLAATCVLSPPEKRIWKNKFWSRTQVKQNI